MSFQQGCFLFLSPQAQDLVGTAFDTKDGKAISFMGGPSTGVPRVSIVSSVSHMPSCHTSRFARVGFQLPCRARRVVSQRRVSRVGRVSRVSRVGRHGKPSRINLEQKAQRSHLARRVSAKKGSECIGQISFSL